MSGNLPVVSSGSSCPENGISSASCLMDNQSSSDLVATEIATINVEQSLLSGKADGKILSILAMNLNSKLLYSWAEDGVKSRDPEPKPIQIIVRGSHSLCLGGYSKT